MMIKLQSIEDRAQATLDAMEHNTLSHGRSDKDRARMAQSSGDSVGFPLTGKSKEQLLPPVKRHDDLPRLRTLNAVVLPHGGVLITPREARAQGWRSTMERHKMLRGKVQVSRVIK